ncbi:hypothetical protein [Synechococcus sp. CBW1107]|uniref:hypothetical protein n=1 Tax=Synechococcus sp. CBW1107 TaxID=2789857 RepID=UPI002AD38D39|nr:hypothetical protein [Synechococcus sp. CBW1107]CAK6691700.1 hypothetical protein ICNINCKA_01064 [Synechococcus sp. CBW1107]
MPSRRGHLLGGVVSGIDLDLIGIALLDIRDLDQVKEELVKVLLLALSGYLVASRGANRSPLN